MNIKKIIFITICIFIDVNLYNAFSENNTENFVLLKIPSYSSEPIKIDKRYFDRYSVLKYFTVNNQDPFVHIHDLNFYCDIVAQLLDSAGKLNEDVFVNNIYKNNEHTASVIKQILFNILRNVQNAVQSLLQKDQYKSSNNFKEVRTFYDLLMGDVANIIFTSDYIKDNVLKYYNSNYVPNF